MPFDAPAAWPENGDRLLSQTGPDSDHIAYLDVFNHNPWLYAEGYYIAAQRLCEIAITTREQDHLVYPALFLGRHYIELMLKDLIAIGAAIAERRIHGWVRNAHDLRRLWSVAKEGVAVEGRRDAAESVVENCILELAEIDPLSFAFRYPTNRRGQPYLPESLARINLRNFSKVLERIHIFLNATYDYQYEGWQAMPHDQ